MDKIWVLPLLAFCLIGTLAAADTEKSATGGRPNIFTLFKLLFAAEGLALLVYLII